MKREFICKEVGDLTDCIFCKIVKKEIPSEIDSKDDDVLAFRDIKPAAPVHILIIPKHHVASLVDLAEEDKEIMGHSHVYRVKLARDLGIGDSLGLL